MSVRLCLVHDLSFFSPPCWTGSIFIWNNNAGIWLEELVDRLRLHCSESCGAASAARHGCANGAEPRADA